MKLCYLLSIVDVLDIFFVNYSATCYIFFTSNKHQSNGGFKRLLALTSVLHLKCCLRGFFLYRNYSNPLPKKFYFREKFMALTAHIVGVVHHGNGYKLNTQLELLQPQRLIYIILTLHIV